MAIRTFQSVVFDVAFNGQFSGCPTKVYHFRLIILFKNIMQEKSKETWRYFWAKTNREKPESSETHPLFAHLFDVGHTALLLWERDIIAKSLKAEICTTLGMNPQEAGHFLALCIGLHDLGKAIPPFQFQHSFSKTRLVQEHGFPFKQNYEQAEDQMAHGHASVLIFKRWIERQSELDAAQRKFMQNIALWIGFHHGNIVSKDHIEGKQHIAGSSVWKVAQDQLLEQVISAWQTQYPFSFPRAVISRRKSHPSWLLAFAGFVTLADWLGSMGEYFSPLYDTPPDVDLQTYLVQSRQNAEKALSSAGFGLTATMQARGFATLFPELQQFPMRPLQVQSLNLPLAPDHQASLTIVEAPTGEGKTEAGFILANRQQAQIQQGIYVAMPTQAMSNGLFGRFNQFLAHSHTENDIVNVRLVHGNDFLSDDQQQLLFSPLWEDILNEENEDNKSISQNQENVILHKEVHLKTVRWFMPKKRALLARYGLGTIDQALLSVLYAKHFFLRLYSLAGKTIIFDEVHAYDAYMTDLLCRLIEWLKALNCQVILLSATLPSKTRNTFLSAFDVEMSSETKPENVPYPCLWTSLKTTPIPFEHDKSREQKAHLHWKSDNLDDLAAEIRTQYAKGATLAVILNTVDRTQRLFDLLQDLKEQAPDDVHLFHARFPLEKRQEIEKAVLARFGKKRDLRSSILIATQVAEASLDLDFDAMYSELAPVDLLLQRAGRLHRHQRVRPEGFKEPALYLLCGEGDELPNVEAVSGYGKVYSRIILWRTFLVLQETGNWHLPFDYRPLIEAVYPQEGETQAPSFLSKKMQEKWNQNVKKLEIEEQKQKSEAHHRMINCPTESEKLSEGNEIQLKDEDDPNVLKALKAVTRLGDSISVICLHQKSKGDKDLFLDRGYKISLNTSLFADEKKYTKKPSHQKAVDFKTFYLQSLSLSAKDVLHAIRKNQGTKGTNLPNWWKQIVLCLPALQYHYPLVFVNGVWEMENTRSIRFDAEQGLIIRKDKIENSESDD
jgi:CRISPR-associated endonuclease/helicase Cas3